MKYIYILILPIFFMACQQEKIEYTEQEELVSVHLVLPNQEKESKTDDGMYHISTYAPPAFESVVETVDVLVFKTDAGDPTNVNLGTYLYRPTITHTTGQTSFKMELKFRTDPQTLVVLVNARSQINALTLVKDDTKASVIARLNEAKATAWDATTMTEVPMWGEIQNKIIDENTSTSTAMNVTMVRMLAKINITNNATATFVMKSAYLYNPKQKGTMMPDNWNGTTVAVNTPTMPTGANTTVGSKFAYTTTTGEFEDMIYTFESNTKTGAITDPLDQTCIVVGGSYLGSTQDFYYRVDFKTTDLYDLLRNHSYNITLTRINFEGSDTPDGAYRGETKIEATVDPWNDMNGDFSFGADHLYVSQQALTVNGNENTAANSQCKLVIKTTNPAGWQIVNNTSGGWMSTTIQSGVANVATTTIIGASSNPKFCERESSFQIKSGNLTRTIKVTQIGHPSCGQNGIPLARAVGSNNYLTHAIGCLCVTLQNSREGSPDYKQGYGVGTSQAKPAGARGHYYHARFVKQRNPCPSPWKIPNRAEADEIRAGLGKSGVKQYWIGPDSGPHHAGRLDTEQPWNGAVKLKWTLWDQESFWMIEDDYTQQVNGWYMNTMHGSKTLTFPDGASLYEGDMWGGPGIGTIHLFSYGSVRCIRR